VAGLSVVVLCLAAGGIAHANIPDTGGVIHACFKKTSPNQGTLRVIDSDKGQSCSGGENALDWNQTGPQGPAGTAVAFAAVSAGGIVNAGASENVAQASVSHPADGLYCFGGLGFTPKSVVITPISGINANLEPTNIDTIATAIIAFPPTSTAFGCADTDNVRVRTIAASSPTTLANRGFLIWFEG
jgi:hypothetical protein